MTPEAFADCIAEIESSGNPHEWGDHDRAVGLFQVHIDWLFDHARRWNLYPSLGEKFNDFVRRVVIRFAQEFLPVWADVEVAMAFHEGHHTLASDLDWDGEYEGKFNAAATKRGFLPAQVRIRNTL